MRENSRNPLIAACISLAVTSLLVRLWGGLGVNPTFLNADEVQVIQWAQSIALDKPSTWQGRMDAAVELVMLVPIRATQVLFGSTIEGSRMAHVIIGSLTVVAFFWFARWLIGDFAGWIAGLLLAVNHVHVYFSRNVTAAATQSTLAAALVLAFGLAGMQRPVFWVLTGLALGWGLRTYPMGWPLLPLLFASFWLWRHELPRPRWFLMMGVVFGVAVLTCSDWVLWMIRHYPKSMEHVTQQRVVSVDGRLFHMWKSITGFWVTCDHAGNYGASIPALDPVTGGLFLAGIGYALWRWRTPAGRFFLLWFPVLMGPVLLSKNVPGYYRIMPALLCACLVSAWVLCAAAHAAVRPVVARTLVLIVVALSACFNFHYTFVKYPAETSQWPTSQGLLVVQKSCRSHSISQADRDYWLGPNAPKYYLQLFQIQCPDLLKQIGVGGAG